MKKPARRIHTIDILRAIAILLMVLAHVYDNWLQPDSWWIGAFSYLILSPFGVPGFVFCSGLSFGFSWDKNKRKGLLRSQNARYSLSRTYIILGIAFGYNLVGVLLHGGGWGNLWFWYILQTIAVARLISIVFMRLSRLARLITSFIIIAFTHFLFFSLFSCQSDSGVCQFFYWFAFNSVNADSLFFFFPFFLIGTVFGEIMSEFREDGISKNMIRQWLLLGLITTVIAVLMGGSPSSYNFGWEKLISGINTHPEINLSQFPLFLTRNSYAWVLYSLGLLIVFMTIFYYFLDYRNIKKGDSTPAKILFVVLEPFGKYSLTIYITHYVLHLMPVSLSYRWILFAYFGLCGIIWAMVAAIHRFTSGKLSIEFIVGYYAKEIYEWQEDRIAHETMDNKENH